MGEHLLVVQGGLLQFLLPSIGQLDRRIHQAFFAYCVCRPLRVHRQDAGMGDTGLAPELWCAFRSAASKKAAEEAQELRHPNFR